MNKVLIYWAIVLAVALSFSVSGASLGIEIGLSPYSLDLSTSLTQVLPAVTSALTTLGVSSTDVAPIIAGVNSTLAQISTILPTNSLPIPLVFGSFSLSLPFLIVDEVRLSSGFLDDVLLREMANMAGETLSRPLFYGRIPIGGAQGSVAIDPTFSTFWLATEIGKRFDLFLMAFDLSAGVDLIQGTFDPHVQVTVPPAYAANVNSSLATLHLDGLSWSAFAVHGGLGIELGPPFLRLVARGEFLLPLSQESGWWGLTIGWASLTLGMVIRF